MNDFTKEELEEIQYLIEEREDKYGVFGRHNLGQKIQYLIDSYCNHEEKTPGNRECFGCDKVFCSACGGGLK